MKIAENSIKGITTPIEELNSKSSIQAAWRFYNNENVDINEISEMVENESKKVIEKVNNKYILTAHDWSWLDFKNHKSKEDLIEINKKGNTKQIGYDLHSSLLINPDNGNPLSPMVMNLQTSKNIYSTYDENLSVNLTHLEELSKRCKYIDKIANKQNKKAVHIIDREADSVLFMRELQKENSLFIIRVKDNAKVYLDEKDIEIKQKELAKELELGEEVGKIKYHKKQARLFVNECDIIITRDYSKMIIDETTNKRKLIKIPGEPVKARFIVSRVVDFKNHTLATWMLVTNVKDIEAKTIAKWYYYRWNIESYFKLLKTTGFNLEKWQQEKPLALFKRLIVVTYAIILVFKLANSEDENAKKIREFLVKLSGKVMEYKKEYTLPALLTGLWIFLRIMDVLSHFSIDELYALREQTQDIIDFNLFEV